MCIGKLLRSRTLARKVYKSLMSEGYRELKWPCPLCYDIGVLVSYVMKTPSGGCAQCAEESCSAAAHFVVTVREKIDNSEKKG
ncbi:MAG: hypothetical protein SOV67_03445 [Bariatricus massiliensis]|nr:hypothetical protein [Bariatricus massiliensis]